MSTVSHEKGKIAFLQLSATLKQVDSNGRKLIFTLLFLLLSQWEINIMKIFGCVWFEGLLRVDFHKFRVCCLSHGITPTIRNGKFHY